MTIAKPAGRWLIGVVALILMITWPGAASAEQTTPNRAGLVIVHGDGQVSKRCVEFTGSEITGLDLLQSTGLDLNVDASNAVGVAVCRIDNEGCTFPGQACFCQCQGSPCVYWSYWHLTSTNTWKYSSMGTASSAVHAGDVDGWVWGAGTISSASPPPSVTFTEICPSPTATATPTETPTETPVPPTETPALPTDTPVPATNTPRPTRTPTRTPVPATSTPEATAVAAASSTDTPLPPTSTPEPDATAADAVAAATETPAASGDGAPVANASVEPAETPAVGEPGASVTTGAPVTEAALASETGTPVASPALVAKAPPSATPRPKRAGPTPTRLLALDRRPTATPAQSAEEPVASKVLLVVALALAAAGATGVTFLVIRKLW